MTERAWYATKATALTLAIFVVVVIAPTAIIGVPWLAVVFVASVFALLVLTVWQAFYDHRRDGGDT